MNKDEMNKLKVGRPTWLHFTFNIDLAMTLNYIETSFRLMEGKGFIQNEFIYCSCKMIESETVQS